VNDETDPAEHDDVRRLLAEARHDEPVPAAVAERLDQVLAGLRREGADSPVAAPVIPLEAHRRRRAAGLLVAAAAIVVGGVALAQQHRPGDSGASAGAGSVESDNLGNGNTGADASGKSPSSQPASPGPRVDLHASGRVRTKGGALVVRPGHFASDVLAGLRVTAPSTQRQYDALKQVEPGCVPTAGDGVVLRATYEKAPAALVYHPPAGSTQVVDLYVCGTAKPVRSVTLPVP
jgi:hypothetical protein